MRLMYCPSNACAHDQWEVVTLGLEHWYIGAFEVVALHPCCPRCGTDLTPRPATIIEEVNILRFLNTLG